MGKLKQALALLLALMLLLTTAVSEEQFAPEAMEELAAEEPAQQEPVEEEPPIEEPTEEESTGEEPVIEDPAIEKQTEESATDSEKTIEEVQPEISEFESAETIDFAAEKAVNEVQVLKREGNTANSAKLEQVLCDELELTRFSGSEIKYIGFADYDGDGKGEAFAYVHHNPKEKPENPIERIYFVTEKAVKALYPQSIEDAGKSTYLTGEFHIWDLGNNNCLFFAREYNEIHYKGKIWAVEKGKAKNITNQFPGDAGIGHLSGNEFLCTFDVWGFGHGYATKYFFYYKNGKFREFGSKEISKKQFLEFAGAQKILREAEAKGCTLENIIYRSCGFIHLNFRKKAGDGIYTYWFYTVRYDDTSVKLYESDEGSYIKASTKNATAPKSFKHPKGISKIAINAPKTTINQGEKLQLTTALTPAIADTTLNWKSSKPKIAAVDANGLVTAKGEGKAKITVTSGNGKTKSVTIAVVDPYKPTGVKLDQTGTVELDMSKTLTLRATLQPSTAQSDLSWKSSNKKIATVQNGVVKPLKEGKVKITVTTTKKNTKGKKMSASVTIKVVNANRPTGISLGNYTSITIAVGGTGQLIPTLMPATAVTGLTWKSSNKKYVTVDQQGVIKGIKKGKATISVTTYNGKTAKCTVTVKKASDPSYSPEVDPYDPSHPDPGPTPVPPSGHNPPNVTAAPPAVDPEKW